MSDDLSGTLSVQNVLFRKLFLMTGWRRLSSSVRRGNPSCLFLADFKTGSQTVGQDGLRSGGLYV